MTTRLLTYCLFTLILLCSSCGQAPKENSIKEAEVTIDTNRHSNSTINENDSSYKALIIKVEQTFFDNIKTIDKEGRENNFLKFREILTKHNKTIYDLYLELSEIKKNAELISRAKGVEITSQGKERITENYYLSYRKEILAGKDAFQSKYGFDNRLLQCFEMNYCFCYTGKQDENCDSIGNCKLVNGEFWKNTIFGTQ